MCHKIAQPVHDKASEIEHQLRFEPIGINLFCGKNTLSNFTYNNTFETNDIDIYRCRLCHKLIINYFKKLITFKSKIIRL